MKWAQTGNSEVLRGSGRSILFWDVPKVLVFSMELKSVARFKY